MEYELRVLPEEFSEISEASISMTRFCGDRWDCSEFNYWVRNKFNLDYDRSYRVVVVDAP